MTKSSSNILKEEQVAKYALRDSSEGILIKTVYQQYRDRKIDHWGAWVA